MSSSLFDHVRRDRMFKSDPDFIEHLRRRFLHPLFAGPDDVDSVPSFSCRRTFAPGHHRGAFEYRAAVRFDACRMRLLVELLGRVYLFRVAEQQSVACGHRHADRFRVSRPSGFDFGDRGDSERNRHGGRLVGIGLFAVDKQFHHGLLVLVDFPGAFADGQLQLRERFDTVVTVSVRTSSGTNA